MEINEDTTFTRLKLGKCARCNKNYAEADHECPFSAEIHNDYTPCNCCDECAGECAMDI